MSVSPDVVIMTRAELDALENKWFQKGVERGRFEQRHDDSKARIAKNCAHWKDGVCGHCGVQWQDCQVAGTFACPHFTPR